MQIATVHSRDKKPRVDLRGKKMRKRVVNIVVTFWVCVFQIQYADLLC